MYAMCCWLSHTVMTLPFLHCTWDHFTFFDPLDQSLQKSTRTLYRFFSFMITFKQLHIRLTEKTLIFVISIWRKGNSESYSFKLTVTDFNVHLPVQHYDIFHADRERERLQEIFNWQHLQYKLFYFNQQILIYQLLVRAIQSFKLMTSSISLHR